MLYERRQNGYALSALLVVFALVDVWVIFQTSSKDDLTFLFINAPIFLALIASAVIFSSMTIRVSSDRLDWWLGFKSFHRVVYLDDVTRCVPHRVPLIAGWGIRTNDFKSWLVVVSGRDTVALVLRSGSTLMLGSPEPERICSLIAKRDA
jgi:hypothetical protein